MKKAIQRRMVDKNQSRVPDDSTFYTRVVPALLVGMAVIMLLLILFAFGVITGIVPYQ